jgi:hypothetical protein
MSQFPRAKPTKGARKKREPRQWRTHVAFLGPYDWDGVPICTTCGFRRDHKIHDLNQSAVIDAAEIDARKLGESGDD